MKTSVQQEAPSEPAIPRNTNPERMKRLKQRFPFLKHYDPPRVNPAQWKMMRAGEIMDFFIKHNGDTRASYYEEVYPQLHRYQNGYDPRKNPERDSQVLDPVPRWVLFAMLQEIKLS